MFVGQHASEVFQSPISVEAEDGVPCNNKDTRDIDGLENTEAPGNSQVGIRPSPLRKVMRSIAQMTCIYANACSMHNKQEEWENYNKEHECVMVYSRKIMIYLPRQKHVRSFTQVDHWIYRLFRMYRLGRSGGGVALLGSVLIDRKSVV